MPHKAVNSVMDQGHPSKTTRKRKIKEEREKEKRRVSRKAHYSFPTLIVLFSLLTFASGRGGMGSPAVRPPPPPLVLLVALMAAAAAAEGAQWCIARSAATDAALQAALDYTCGAGAADCQPIQPSGLCYLPNTLPAHASYAFNSFYQRSGLAPSACDFAGTATVTITDPSYGSCTFPSSASNAGGSTTPNTNTSTTTAPVFGVPPPPSFDSTAGGTPGFGPTVPNTDDTSSSLPIMLSLLLSTCCCFLTVLLF